MKKYFLAIENDFFKKKIRIFPEKKMNFFRKIKILKNRKIKILKFRNIFKISKKIFFEK